MLYCIFPSIYLVIFLSEIQHLNLHKSDQKLATLVSELQKRTLISKNKISLINKSGCQVINSKHRKINNILWELASLILLLSWKIPLMISVNLCEQTYWISQASHTVEKWPQPSLRITWYLPLNRSPILTWWYPPDQRHMHCHTMYTEYPAGGVHLKTLLLMQLAWVKLN